MKKMMLLFVCMMALTLMGCSQAQTNGKLLKESDVEKITVSSLPEGYNYSFSLDETNAIVEYLSNLTLISNFPENPDEYSGMTWVIEVEYSDGDSTTIYHFGNMFIRADDGPWYKMDYEEASELGTFIRGENTHGKRNNVCKPDRI